jgi:hypothetical protein
VSERASSGQFRLLYALLDELGVEERDARLSYISETLGAERSTSSDMSIDQVHRVIDRAEHELRNDPRRLLENAARAKAREKRDLLRGLGVRV